MTSASSSNVLACTQKYCDHSFLCSLCIAETCKSPAVVPNFEWINKYQKNSKSLGVVKQALAPLGTPINKLNQQRKTGLRYFFLSFFFLLLTALALITSEAEVVITKKSVKLHCFHSKEVGPCDVT